MKHFFLILFFALLPVTNLIAETAHKGKVIESIHVENYTYIKIIENSKDTWIAIPKLDVKVGDTVETSEGIIMKDFNSPTLKRTFSEIIFATKASVLNSKDAEKITTSNKIPGIFSVSKILENSRDLSGKAITFKGKVTKFTPKIMNKNWVHITDLSNEKLDLVLTTTDVVNIGDIVTMNGTLETDKDLGAGYFFKVIINDAKVVK